MSKEFGLNPSRRLHVSENYVVKTPLVFSLVNGIEANRREARISRTFPGIIVPTRLVGFVAIQPRVDMIELRKGDAERIFLSRLGLRAFTDIEEFLKSPGVFGRPKSSTLRFVNASDKILEAMLHQEGSYIAMQNALKRMAILLMEQDDPPGIPLKNKPRS